MKDKQQNRSITVLILEDNPSDAELMVELIEREGFEIQWERVISEEEFLAALSLSVDLILADHTLPQFDSISALELLNEAGIDCPVIIVSGTISEDAAIGGIRLGADDFVLKDRIKRIGPAASQAIANRKLREAKRTAEEELRQNEERFRLLAENAQDVIYEFSLMPELRIEYVSPAVKILSGFSPSQFYEDPEFFLKIVHPDDRERLVNTIRRPDPGGNTNLFRWETQEGEWVWMEHRSTPVYDEDNELVAINGIARDVTESIEHEKQLRFQAEILQNIHDAVIAADKEFRITYWNKGAEALYGFTGDEMIGQPISSLYPDDKSPRIAVAKSELDLHEKVRQEREILTKSDKRIWIDQMVTKRLNAAGEGVGYLSVSKDITSRKAAELELKENRNLYRQTLTALKEGVILYDFETAEIFACNDAVEEIFGYKPEELLGTNADLLYPSEEALEIHSKHVQRVLTNSPDYQDIVEMVRADGTPILVEHYICHLPSESENGTRGLGVLRDVTEQKEHEQALRESERQFREIFENIQEGYYRTTVGGNFLLVNPQYAKILGYDDPGEFIGNNIADFPCFDQYPRETFIDQIKASGAISGFESTWITKDGDEIIISENAHSVHNEDGGIRFFEGTVSDITEQKELERQLIVSQKMESLGQVASGIAHDFNNVMATLSGAIQMVQTQFNAPAVDNYFKMMHSALTRGESITNRLLTFTRSGVPHRKPLAMLSFLYEIRELVQVSLPKNIQISVHDYDGNDRVAAEKAQLQQVILNMCINASHAMDQGGMITLDLREGTSDEIQTHRPDDSTGFLCLEVGDTGHGMDEETIDRIFEPFFTTKQQGKGTGLGLAVAYKIVQNHGGWIEVDSTPNRGTIFTVALPQSEDLVEADKPEESDNDIGGHGAHILLIEDEISIQQLLTDLLQSNNYRVTIASTGEEGLAKFATLGTSLDLVITDLGLPEISGVEVAKSILQEEKGLSIIAITGYVDENEYQSLKQTGFVEILKKPFDLKNVLRTIARTLR